MQKDKVKITLGGTSASVLGCLWGRAQMSREYRSLFYDAKAIELTEKIDYVPDFSASDVQPFEDVMINIFFSHKINQTRFGLFTLRAKQFDYKVKAYIEEHPYASVINIAAGLDTTFYRVDNGLIRWYDLDLPAVIDIRRQLLPEPDRVIYIAKSLLDPNWFEDVTYTEDGVFMIAGGVLHSLEESQVKQFFSMLADNFPDGEIVFDAMSRLGGGFRARIDMFPPEQRDAMRATLIDALKDWWEEVLKDWWKKAPQDEKDKVSDIVATLKIPTKLKGKEWSDLEAWWDQISDTEKAEALNDLMTAFGGKVGTWSVKDANEITKLNSHITVIDQFPLFKNVPRDSLSADIQRVMDYSDENGGSNIIHLRV